MTRIVGGGGKGRRLKTPKGQGARPTGVRVRQTLFVRHPRRDGAWVLGPQRLRRFGGVGLEDRKGASTARPMV